MRLWSWVYPRGSSVGIATTMANRVIKLQSAGVVVRHHTPTEDRYTSRLLQGNRSPKKANIKLNFRICKVLVVFCRVLWLRSHFLGKFKQCAADLSKAIGQR